MCGVSIFVWGGGGVGGWVGVGARSGACVVWVHVLGVCVGTCMHAHTRVHGLGLQMQV